MKIERPGLYRTRGGDIVTIVLRADVWRSWTLREKYGNPMRTSSWDSMGVPRYAFVGHPDELIEEVTDPIIKALYDNLD